MTPVGLEILAELEQPVAKTDMEAVSMLSAAEQETLIHLLDRIREGIQR